MDEATKRKREARAMAAKDDDEGKVRTRRVARGRRRARGAYLVGEEWDDVMHDTAIVAYAMGRKGWSVSFLNETYIEHFHG